MLCCNAVIWKLADYPSASARPLFDLFTFGGVLPDGVPNLVLADREQTFAGHVQRLLLRCFLDHGPVAGMDVSLQEYVTLWALKVISASNVQGFRDPKSKVRPRAIATKMSAQWRTASNRNCDSCALIAGVVGHRAECCGHRIGRPHHHDGRRFPHQDVSQHRSSNAGQDADQPGREEAEVVEDRLVRTDHGEKASRERVGHEQQAADPVQRSQEQTANPPPPRGTRWRCTTGLEVRRAEDCREAGPGWRRRRNPRRRRRKRHLPCPAVLSGQPEACRGARPRWQSRGRSIAAQRWS